MSSQWFAIAVGTIVLTTLAIISNLEGQQTRPELTLAMSPDVPSLISAVAGDELSVEMLFSNNSAGEVQVSRVVTSCPCVQVSQPVPFSVPSGDVITVPVQVTPTASFEPVEFLIHAFAQNQHGVEQQCTTRLTVHGRQKVRGLPTVVSFGRLERSEGRKSRQVRVFQSRLVADPVSIQRVNVEHAALQVSVHGQPLADAPQDLTSDREIDALTVTLRAEDIEPGAFHERILVEMSDGGVLPLAVTGYVQ